MPVVKTDLVDVHEPKPVPPARYGLTISEAYIADNGNVRVSIGIDEHLDAPNISHTLALDKPDDDERKRSFKKLMRKRFLVAFDIPHDEDGFNTDDFSGCTSELEVTLTLPEENEQRRVFNRLVLPPLSDEEEPKPKASKAPTKKKAGRR